METYTVLEEKNINIIKLVHWHFGIILQSVKRKISNKQTYRDPFFISTTSIIHSDIFYQVFRAIRDYQTTFGTQTQVLRDSKKKVKQYCITFTHFGAFKFYLKKLSGEEDVLQYLLKERYF